MSQAPPVNAGNLSQQDLAVLLDNAPDAIARFDRSLRHIYVNRATAVANHRPASEFEGMTMEDLGHTREICELINRNLEKVFQTARELSVELLFAGPSGPVWYHTRMVPEVSEREVQSVLVISRDISQQRRAEQALLEAEKRAAVARVSSVLAHGIHNPLAAVTNALYLLEHNGSVDEDGRQLLALATRELDRVSQISKQLLILTDPVAATAL